jgi:hypothetical protein
MYAQLIRVGAWLFLVVLLRMTPALGAWAAAQTTTTNCQAYGSQMNCTSTTMQSLEQQQAQQRLQFQQAISQLGAAIAQRRAAEAERRAAWETAATEQARQAANTARANYDATTQALARFVADSMQPTSSIVNSDLRVDWTLLNGVEERSEWRGEQNYRGDEIRRFALTDTPEGGLVVRMDPTTRVFLKKEHMADMVSIARYDPVTQVFLRTQETRPLYQTYPPRTSPLCELNRIGLISETTWEANSHCDACKLPSLAYLRRST